MTVASLDLCRELYELTAWDHTDDHRRIEKVWMQSFSTWEMGQGNEAYDSTPVEERRGYDIGEYRVTENPMNFIGIPEHTPYGWAYRHYREVEQRAIPAYDLGYLLLKCPNSLGKLGDGSLRTFALRKLGDDTFMADYWRSAMDGIELPLFGSQRTGAESSTDAAAKLAIELFKAGHLPKEANR